VASRPCSLLTQPRQSLAPNTCRTRIDVGIIGTGAVGTALARGLSAAEHGEVVVLALPAAAVVDVAGAAPGANVVKAFNTIGANRMTDPVIDGEPATMFLAGAGDDAIGTVAELAADLGFEPVVAGNLAAAALLEDLARFWIALSQTHGRDIGFRLLRED